ncbi:MAG TPA: hypothetical protein VMR02_19610 [Terracidiphilus sp.]|nr:hypothetical protein [Terracidiphilus sp.]
MRADQAIAPGGLDGRERVCLDSGGDRIRKVPGELVSRRRGGWGIVGVPWAPRRGRQEQCRARITANHLRGVFFAHRAVMRAVAAAAGGQARVIGSPEAGRRQWANPEEQQEDDGKHAPHLLKMVHQELSDYGRGASLLRRG